MAWEVPSFFIPVNPNQGGQIASYADRLLGAFDQGQASRRQTDMLNARKALGQESFTNPDGSPNYQSYAQRLMGSGDLEGARVYQGLAQTQEDRNYRRSRDTIGDRQWQMSFDAGRQDAANQREDRRFYFEQGRIPEGFKPAADGNGYVAIPGGPADPNYLGGKAQATQPAPAGFTRAPNGGGYTPVPGGPADPNYIGQAETAKAVAKETAKGAGGPDAEAEGKFRKEIASRAQPFQVVRDAYGRLISSNADAAGDIAMIFSYMRMLDPGSVVREGEFATAQNAAGIPDQIRNIYNKALSGERLNPEQRQMFRAQAKSYFDRAQQDYKALEGQFIGAAQAYGFDPARVIPVYPPLPSDLPPVQGSTKGQDRVMQGGPPRQPNYAPGGGAAAPDPLGIR